MTLSTDPMQETMLTLKERRPFSLTLTCEKQDGSRVDLTGASLRLAISDVARKGGASKIVSAATLVSEVDGTARFDLQAADIDFGTGTFDLAVTLRTAESFETTVLEGTVQVTRNPDPTVTPDFSAVVPPLSLTARFRDQNRVTVKVNHHPDSVLLDAATRAEVARGEATIQADRAENSADAAFVSAAAAHASIALAGAEGEARAAVEADRAAAEADAAAASAEQAAAPTAEQIAVVDADSASLFRVQQDARLAAYARRAQTLTGDHEPGVQIIQSSAINEFQYGVYIADNANNKGRLLKMNHFGGSAASAGAAYALDIQNYPGSGAALVLHQYSDYQSAVILDNTDSRAAILMRNTQNDTINPGNWGTGDYFQLDGYELGVEGAGAGTVKKLGTLNQNLVFTSFEQSKPWTFQASGHVNHALYVKASHAGKGIHVDGTGTTSGSNSISVNHSAPSHAVTITGLVGQGNFTCLNISGQAFGALISTSVSNASGYALTVRSTAALGKTLVVHNRGSSDSITVENNTETLFAVTAAGLPRWTAAANQQTTVGAAGAAAALPATPTKYLKVVDSAGVTYVIPAYAAS